MNRLLVGLIVCVACAWRAEPVAGHETDQFTSPPGRDFADLANEFTPWVYATVERAVNRTNQEIRRRLEAGATEQSLTGPDSHEEVALNVFHEFPIAYSAIEGLEVKLHGPELRREYPGQVIGHKTTFGQIYQGAHFPLDPRRFFKFWFASTFKAYGVHSGTDKVGHFIDMGQMYYREYRKALKAGKTDAEARRAAVRFGTEHPIFSESGVLGYLSAGAYSNADLASNYSGLLFYINVTQPVKLQGELRPAMLERDGAYWRIAPHVRPNSDFFSWFFSDHWDEALNPSRFEGSMRGGMRRAVRARADNLLWRYRDVHGCRRPAAYFDALAKELTTYWGEDYGHSGKRHELITLGNACFQPVSESARPDKRNETGHTALHWAVEAGDTAAVRRLLKRGFPVDAPMKPQGRFADSEEGNTALHLAARDGRQEIIALLLEHGAKVNATNRWGVTPLHRAADAQSAAMLLASGAKVDAAERSGRTPLHWAAQNPRSTSVPALLDAAADVKVADHRGLTPLHLAVATGSADSARRLVEHDADVNAADALGIRPLHVAAERGADQMVRLLLAQGAEANAADGFGYTPLHLAARRGEPGTAAALVDGGASVKAADSYGTTPLHLAARHSSRGVVELLIGAGADVRATGIAGVTPLHEAAASGDRSTVVRLLEAGASAAAADQRGRTARQVAAARGFNSIVQVFDGPSSTQALGIPRDKSRNGARGGFIR